MRIAIIHLGRKGGGPPYILDMAKALSMQGVTIRAFVSSDVKGWMLSIYRHTNLQ